jgi:Na+/H+ antiporter NhaD/arsenite permease-like protein
VSDETLSSSPSLPGKPAPLLHLGHPESHIPLFDPPDSPSPEVPHKRLMLAGVLGILLAFAGQWLEQVGATAVAPQVGLPWVLPFALLLACIAVMPFAAKHFWEKHYHHMALALGAVVTAYYVFLLPAAAGAGGGSAAKSMARSFGDYTSFIFLLGSLFTVSGGILIRVRRSATPAVNTLLLLAGAILANVFGTTGAAMLLIRPYLRINKGHIRPYHVVFFIFLVANVGGSLTPIGDPPLFLGYLKGVPFWWVAEHCWPMWCLAVGVLLAVFYVLDRRAQGRQERAAHDPNDLGPPISLYGGANLLLVFAILAGVLLHDDFNAWWSGLPMAGRIGLHHLPLRELIMIAAIVASLWTTPPRIHIENVFNFAPIREVALLFIGIFATMVPALNYLSNHAHDPAIERVLHTPGQFYYFSGTLSSVLDNAPTYLTFLETELGKLDPDEAAFIRNVVKTPGKERPTEDDLAAFRTAHPQRFTEAGAAAAFAASTNAVCDTLIRYHKDKVASGNISDNQIRIGMLLGDERLNWYIVAISLGAVFFGAMTYIGNGPNFMVKSIAEHADVPCPSFFGYILMYALPVLLPTLVLVWAVFLRPHAGM